MADSPAIAPELVTALVPVLSRSLAEQFNVFRVMHHGTHEKQLSNVFAWLLDEQGTHELGDAPQRIFLELVNAKLPEDAHLPQSGYAVAQEVVTPGDEDKVDLESADICDILLSSPEAALVVENFGTSDGHGHDFRRYLALGTAGGRSAAVVLLCETHTPHLQRDGWEQAVVVTYAEMLNALRAHITDDRKWTREHPDQGFFIRQLYEHFVEGPTAMNTEDTLDFLTAMCKTEESARYGHRPRERAVQEFGELIAAQARRQFEEGLEVLAATKQALSTYARSVLMEQVNGAIAEGPIRRVVTRFKGQYEWCVELHRPEGHMAIGLVFGPTAVVDQARVPRPQENPDYSRVFIRLQTDTQVPVQVTDSRQTSVRLAEVLEGLPRDDVRLRDAVLQILETQQRQG